MPSPTSRPAWAAAGKRLMLGGLAAGVLSVLAQLAGLTVVAAVLLVVFLVCELVGSFGLIRSMRPADEVD